MYSPSFNVYINDGLHSMMFLKRQIYLVKIVLSMPGVKVNETLVMLVTMQNYTS